MAYKYSTGSLHQGDIYYEDDRTGAPTYIDFGMDTITLRPSGSAILFAGANAVGIGTTDPDNTLHVKSSGTTHVKIESEEGSEAAVKLKSGDQNSVYLWAVGGTPDLRFYVNGADRMHLDGDGSVGIGTTDPITTLDTHFNNMAMDNDTGGGWVVKFGSGTLTAGKLYYLHTDGAWTATDADAATTGGDQLLGIALGTAPGTHGVLLRGFFDAHTYLDTHTSGKAVYISVTAGEMTTTAPSATGDIIRIIGYCTSQSKVIYFNPSSTFVELS